MRFIKLLPLALIIFALALTVCGCKKSVAKVETESESKKPVSTPIDEIEKKATDAGYVCNRKEAEGIKGINEDIEESEANGTLINCIEISSLSNHTKAIVCEFDSAERASEFYEKSSEALFGKLSEGLSKDCRDTLFIYGDTSIIEKIW